MKFIYSSLLILTLFLTGCGKEESQEFPDQKNIFVETDGQNISVVPSKTNQITVKSEDEVITDVKQEGIYFSLADTKPINFKTSTLTIAIPNNNHDAISLVSTSGKIKGKEVHAAKLYSKSDSGSIHLSSIQGEQIEIETLSGNATLTSDNQLTKDANIKTDTGDIHIVFKKEMDNILLDLQTTSGSIHTPFQKDPTIDNGKQRLTFKKGDVEHTLSLESNSGTINVDDSK
jgi:DUF4097 and DUF4098 domain-containing protein YvlB